MVQSLCEPCGDPSPFCERRFFACYALRDRMGLQLQSAMFSVSAPFIVLGSQCGRPGPAAAARRPGLPACGGRIEKSACAAARPFGWSRTFSFVIAGLRLVQGFNDPCLKTLIFQPLTRHLSIRWPRLHRFQKTAGDGSRSDSAITANPMAMRMILSSVVGSEKSCQ
jgi:hypothetical protein